MKLQAFVVPLSVATTLVYGRPTAESRRAIFDSPGLLDDVLLFDGAAFPDPSNPANTLLQMQTYVSLRTPDLGVVTSAVTEFLSSVGVSVGNSLNILQERLDVLASIGIPGKVVEVSVPGCSTKAKLPKTAGRDLGLANGIVSLGTCGGEKEAEATVTAGFLDSRDIKASVFFSPDSGFGVISDIDDTIKVSNVLDTATLLKSTLLEEPKAVPGMPELYSSLATSLNQPQFIYITATPYQFYPFLNNFIDTSFSNSKGPLFTQNLTVVDIPEVIEFLTKSGSDPLAYKLSMIDRVQAMYPNKKWLVVGDSTQKDPEVYAAALKKHGANFISCIWIREVEGADNSEGRFSAAFEGVPAERIRRFTDIEIGAMRELDVAGGKC